MNSFRGKNYHLRKYRSHSRRYCSSSKHRRTVFEITKEWFDFKSKIGGMEQILEEVFGNIMLRRKYPHDFVIKTKTNKTYDILLYATASTGKSLVARTICNVLNVDTKVVRGPEISLYILGEPQRKVRDLFDDTHRDQKKFMTNGKLLAIIFDEIDVICKSWIHNGLIYGMVHDNVIAQLLSETDGMVYLDKILLVVTKNVLEAIDSALLRVDRL